MNRWGYSRRSGVRCLSFLRLFWHKRAAIERLDDALNRHDATSIALAERSVRESEASFASIRGEMKQVVAAAVPHANTKDADYVFLSFVMRNLPRGIVGLLLAVIFCTSKKTQAHTTRTRSTRSRGTSTDVQGRLQENLQENSGTHHAQIRARGSSDPGAPTRFTRRDSSRQTDCSAWERQALCSRARNQASESTTESRPCRSSHTETACTGLDKRWPRGSRLDPQPYRPVLPNRRSAPRRCRRSLAPNSRWRLRRCSKWRPRARDRSLRQGAPAPDSSHTQAWRAE